MRYPGKAINFTQQEKYVISYKPYYLRQDAILYSHLLYAERHTI